MKHSALCHRGTSVWLLVVVVTMSRLALSQQPLLQITSPLSGTVVNPGQSISVTVAVASGVPFTGVVVVSRNPIGFSNVVTTGPFQFSMTIPKIINAGQYQLRAEGTTGSGPEVFSEPVSIDIERADSPTKLVAAPPQLIFRSQGGQVPIRIRGTFSDGSVLDLTESSNMSYSSSNTGVATVGSTGMVTPVGAGTASIVATYAQNVQVTIPITVPSPMLTPSRK